MGTVQTSVYIPIPVTDGSEESADVVVASNGNSDLEASRSKGQEGSARGFLTEILLGAGIFVLWRTGSSNPFSFHRIRNDRLKAGSFLRGAVVEILDFHASPVNQDSPQSSSSVPSKFNVQLRYTPPHPIFPELSSMESPSEEGYVPSKRGSSPSYNSKDVRNWFKRGESSDSLNASDERISSVDGSDSDSIASMKGHVTRRTIASEDDITLSTSYDDEPDTITPMTPRRYI